jgi:glycosyltransferase involved in cell wall biosynthesis
MYDMKRLPLLIDAAKRAHAEFPPLVLVLAGAGSDQWVAEEAARSHEFVHYVGPVIEERKAALYAVADSVVLPGLVGLGVVDAFQYGLPPIATTFPFHSPEIVYLRDGVNGLIVDDTPECLAAAMIKLATDEALYRRLVAGSKETAKTVTVEEMARRFASGILKAIEI